jgi:hypothetical protein
MQAFVFRSQLSVHQFSPPLLMDLPLRLSRELDQPAKRLRLEQELLDSKLVIKSEPKHGVWKHFVFIKFSYKLINPHAQALNEIGTRIIGIYEDGPRIAVGLNVEADA